MQVTGKHIDVTNAIRNFCEEEFYKVEKSTYITDKSVVFGKNNKLYEVVVKAKTINGADFNAHSEGSDLYEQISAACKRLRKQIDKENNKAKYKHHEIK